LLPLRYTLLKKFDFVSMSGIFAEHTIAITALRIKKIIVPIKQYAK